ncbi:MAG: hypothetical protein ACK55X_14675 [Synechococcaceae cyanobacterium]
MILAVVAQASPPAQASAPAPAELAPRPLSALPADLQPLVHDLQARGFRVRIALPPVRQAYGLFDRRSRTLWLSPLAFELGIARPTFLHEAVHAVQSCPGGSLTPIGWRFSLPAVVEQEISGILTTGYHQSTRTLEQEAFGLQAQSDAVARLRQALRQRCPLP